MNHACAKAVPDEAGYDLRSAYDGALQTLTCQDLVTPITVPKEGPYAGAVYWLAKPLFWIRKVKWICRKAVI